MSKKDTVSTHSGRPEKLSQELTDDELDFVPKQISKESGLDFSICFKNCYAHKITFCKDL